PFQRAVTVARCVFPLEGQSRPAFVVNLDDGVPGETGFFQVVVDAVDGTILHRINRVLSVTLKGDIFPESPDPEGNGPDDNGDLNPNDEQVRVSFAANPVASPQGWIFAGQTKTQGNNVLVSIDLNDLNDQNGLKANGGRNLEFYFPFANQWEALGTFGDQEAAVT